MDKNVKNSVEIERKYVIEMPNIDILRKQKGYTVSSILQIYLPSKTGETHRIRRREYDGRTVCTETRKIRLDKMSATEIERKISLDEFESLAAKSLGGTVPISKMRHTFIYEGQLFEIDIYPQWENTAIMETELDSREKNVKIPSFIHILREVTGDKSYSNASMSRSFPRELV